MLECGQLSILVHLLVFGSLSASEQGLETEPGDTRILRLYPTSLEECLDACLTKSYCRSVVHERLVNICDLHNTSQPPNSVKYPGRIVVFRSDIRKGVFGQRNDKSTTHNQAEKNPVDCVDVGSNGIVWSGIYKIYPGNETAIEVFCDFDDLDGPWTVIQRRVDDSVDFFRSFQSYQEGFGDLAGNFWLGLDAISALTLSGNYTLKVIIVDIVKRERFAKYSKFQVLDVSTGYMLQVAGYSGNAGDSLVAHNGRPFSTYDRDMDDGDENCASDFFGAWWFTYCVTSHLNGIYGKRGVYGGIVWITTTDDRDAIFATMKVKRGKYI